MKKTAAVLLLLTSILYSQIKPVAGESFTIRYNPAEKGILKDAKEIYLRYVLITGEPVPAGIMLPKKCS